MDAIARDAFDDNVQHIRCQLFTVVVELGNVVMGVCLRACCLCFLSVCLCFGVDLDSRDDELCVCVGWSWAYE